MEKLRALLEAIKGLKTGETRELIRKYIANLPVTIFYQYLWDNNKMLLCKMVALNYLIPFWMELLPWWASRRRLGNRLREDRIRLTHNMQTRAPFDARFATTYFYFSVLHVVFDALQRHIQKRIALENKLLIRKLVLERLLFAEIYAFEEIEIEEVEKRVSCDITLTLNFLNFTLPTMISTGYALFIEGSEFYQQRHSVDRLMVIFSIGMFTFKKTMDFLKTRVLEQRQKKRAKAGKTKMARLISNLMSGLSDIQVNNLQQSQLLALDDLIKDELSSSYGFTSFVNSTWATVGSRSMMEFVTELWVVHKVMERQNIDYEQYSIMQKNIDRWIRLATRMHSLLYETKTMFDDQGKVMELVNIPHWIKEDNELTHVSEFQELRVRNLQFAYSKSQTFALDLMDQEMVFLPGKRYAIIGQNRAGKSTLANILCKLYNPDSDGVFFNGIPYKYISRKSIRSLMAYVSQRPFIFPGTVRENILIGKPDATEEEIIEAAEAAGVFAYMSPAEQTPRGNRNRSEIPRPKSFTEQCQRTQTPQIVVKTPSANSLVPKLNLQTKTTVRRRSHIRSNRSDQDLTKLPKTHKRSRSTSSGTGHWHSRNGSVPRDLFDMDKRVDFSFESAESAILNEQVKARGENISGGFAQSVALARMFVRKDAQLLILDEALGQMDAMKKRHIIFPNLDSFVAEHNATLIIVTHDMELIRDGDFDNIFVMEHGCLAHQGTHEELVEEGAEEYLELVGLDVQVEEYQPPP